MTSRKLITTIFCVLAYTIVFAHSIIPHSHHCSEHNEDHSSGHIHFFSHCEELNTYLISSDDIQLSPCILEFYPYLLKDYNIIAENNFIQLNFNPNSHFKDHSCLFYRDNCTRAP